MFCHKCGSQLIEGANFCPKCGTKALHKDAVQKSTEMAEINDIVSQQSAKDTYPANQKTQIAQENMIKKRKIRKLSVILGIMALTIVLAIIIAVNWEGKVDYAATVKAHTPFAISQELPYTYEEVLNKYFDSLEWEVREEENIHYVDISGIDKGMGSKFDLTIKVSQNPDVSDEVLIQPESVILAGRQSATEDEAIEVLYSLFCMYDEGYEINAESEFTVMNEELYSEYEETVRPVIIDWFDRHPLMESIRIQFMNEIAKGDDGNGDLVYEMCSISGEEYGIFYVDPENGNMMMDSVIDNNGKWSSIQVTMDQWYLEYYWGWTENSGYYSERYSDDIEIIYDEEGYEILEYSPGYNQYAICNFDGSCLIEYDDGSAVSEINIMDFVGSYVYDASFEEEGYFFNFCYVLEIGEWNGYYFSINETWRGNAIIQDEYARPKSLIVDTLTFEVFNPDVGYETHSLTYIPAKSSPLGQDVIYLDGDDTMPFVRE